MKLKLALSSVQFVKDLHQLVMLKTLLITSLLTLAGTVFALQSGSGDTSSDGAASAIEISDFATLQGGGVSLSQAVEQVRRQYKGRIVSAVTEIQGNREVHVIKVLTNDGKVKTVRIQGQKRG